MRKIFYSIGVICLTVLLSACHGNKSDGKLLSVSENDQTQSGLLTTDAFDDAAKPRNKKRHTSVSGIEIPAKMRNTTELILRRTGYTVSYNTDTKIPNWVAWKLTASHTSGGSERHRYAYHEDMEAPSPRVTNDDYFNSGFDRGHMCPAGDNKWDNQAMDETFLFTNMCPQVHKLNTGPWNDLELACRKWARQYGEIYIVCGPLLSKGQHRTIGRRKVVVPERFFKVILCTRGNPKAIGFIYDNSGSNSEKMFSHATNVDEVERLTGIDFFPALDDKIEDVVEAERGYF